MLIQCSSITTSSPNASPHDIVAVRTKSSFDIRNDTLSQSSDDMRDLDIPPFNDDIVSLLQKGNYKLCFIVGMHHSSPQSVGSTLDTGTGPKLSRPIDSPPVM